MESSHSGDCTRQSAISPFDADGVVVTPAFGLRCGRALCMLRSLKGRFPDRDWLRGSDSRKASGLDARWQETLLHLAILFLAAAIPFARQLILGAGILDDDLFGQSMPAWEWFARSLRAGESVLWCPDILGGLPMAFTQYPFLYPLTFVLAWFLTPLQAYAWSLVLHLALAGSLTYGFCRVIGLSGSASLLAALSFQMSTEVATGVSGFAASSAFALPGVLLSAELLMRWGRRYGLLLSAVVAVAFLEGHMPVLVWCLAASGGYVLYRVGLKAVLTGEQAMRYTAWILVSVVLGFAMASVRLIPMSEVMLLSARREPLPTSVSAGGAASVHGLIAGHLLPLSHVQTLDWGTANYVGPSALILALLGLRGSLRISLEGFFVFTAVTAGLLSMGESTPLHLLTRLPGLSLFRDISRVSIVLGFALSILGGMTLDRLSVDGGFQTRSWATRIRIASALVSLCVGAAFAVGLLFSFGHDLHLEAWCSWWIERGLDGLNPLRPRMALALAGLPCVMIVLLAFSTGRLSRQWMERLLVAVTLAVLVPIATILRPSIEVGTLARVPETVRHMQEQPGLYRTYSHAPWLHMYNHMVTFGPTPEEGFAADFRYRYESEALAPNLFLRWGIGSADGYDPLHSRWQDVVLRYILSDQFVKWVQSPEKWTSISFQERVRVLRMLNVRYVVSAADLSRQVPELRLVMTAQVDRGLSRASPRVLLFENIGFLPRYYLVANSRQLSDGEDPLYEVATGRVDPADVVLLQELQASAGRVPMERSESGEPWHRAVEVVSYRNGEVLVRATTSQPAYLVTSDSYWPGWRAFVDSREVPILRANLNGRAVWLEAPGTHTVRFRFEPPGFALGLGISIAATVVWVLWLGLSLYSGRRVAH